MKFKFSGEISLAAPTDPLAANSFAIVEYMGSKYLVFSKHGSDEGQMCLGAMACVEPGSCVSVDSDNNTEDFARAYQVLDVNTSYSDRTIVEVAELRAIGTLLQNDYNVRFHG